jgi:hypothetical protein
MLRSRFVLLALSACVSLPSLACRQTSAEAPPPTPAPAQQADATAYDPRLTDAARLLAGLPPESSGGPLAATAEQPEWRAWQKEFDAQWTAASRDRFSLMAAWRDRELSPLTGPCETLMYPFAGPDILNAVLLFPGCRRYILFGLEPTGTLPALDQLPPERLARLLDETRHAMNDLLQRNYFITSHMLEDTAAKELHGTLPLIAAALVRLDARIVRIREMEIDEGGRLRDRTPPAPTKKAAPALEVVFVRPGGEPQTVVYFRAQVEDKMIGQRPGVVPFLEQPGTFPTFLKSASYLLHGAEFSVVRNLLLARSRLILEDDSGIPLRFLKPPDWTVTLYGKYQKPVKDFNYGYQDDLAKAYATDKGVRPLAFSFGYHWKGEGAAVLLAVRGATPAAAQ